MSLNTNREGPSQEEFMERFILFIHPNDKSSLRAITIVDNNQLKNIKLQNICTIPKKFLPDFVTGVPILADTEQQEVLKGTQCLQKLDLLAQNTIGGVSAGVGNGLIKSALDTTLRFKTNEQKQNESKLNQCKSVSEFEKMRNSMLQKPQIDARAAGHDQLIPTVV